MLAEDVGVPRAAARTALKLSAEDARGRNASAQSLSADARRRVAEEARRLLVEGVVGANATGTVQLEDGARGVAVSKRIGDRVTTRIECPPPRLRKRRRAHWTRGPPRHGGGGSTAAAVREDARRGAA